MANGRIPSHHAVAEGAKLLLNVLVY